jgi:cell division FtsZ-interacting protein ZapD
MARGRIKDTRTTVQKLDDIIAQIESTEATLKELKAQKKELQAQLEQEKVDTLLATIKASNLSVEDATNYIKNVAQEDDKAQDIQTA